MAALLPFNVSFGNTSLEESVVRTTCHNISVVPHQNIFIPTIYSIIFILGVLGNGLVLVVLCQGSCRNTVANTYMLNLALSDLLFLLSLPFWAVYYSLDYQWLFGGLMCKLCGGLLTLNLYASIFFITCMSMDRYLAIVHPLTAQSCRRPCRARLLSGLLWVLAGLISIPAVVFRDSHYIQQLGVSACVLHYPGQNWFVALALMKNVLGFLLPFGVISSCYCSIARHLLGAPGLDKRSGNLDKVLKTVLAVVLAFFLCWGPFHVLTFLEVLMSMEALQVCWVEEAVSLGLPFTLCLGFSNSAINPFLYCFVGNHFRGQLSSIYQSHSSSLRPDSLSTRLSSFSRKLNEMRDLGPLDHGAA
ncbi:type-2 angiotensin II receptor-like [Chanos chanos]|uniref:Type-1 angiotensin II receptor n=1 Tax=Chanos chanos TaxID=29144 RepID=A0A6J2WVH7_CHACN|nr:type-2 angiotensin II receptor-like [Chanos chanos]